jgi:hypothetical protein
VALQQRASCLADGAAGGAEPLVELFARRLAEDTLDLPLSAQTFERGGYIIRLSLFAPR